MRRLLVGDTVLLLSMPVLAELRLPALFSDGMVLQQDQEVAVWGWTCSGRAALPDI